MGILREFERRLERAVEGFFSKAFRSGLQPVELAKRVLREMETGKTVGVREVWVPNRYALHVSAQDRERLTGMEKALSQELEQVVVEGARERGYGLVARPQVAFHTDESLGRGEFRVAAAHAEEAGAPPADVGPPARTGEPSLVLMENGTVVTRYPLRGERSVLGRHASSDVEVKDPGASRRHAEIRRRDDRFVITDLGSTNGTLVNGSEIRERVLEEGDRITIGRTTLEFRRG